MIARAAVLIALVPSAGAFLPPAVGRHSSALRAQASQVVQVEEKPGSFMRDEVPDDGLQKWVAVCEIVADKEKRMARRRALQQDHVVWERTVMLPSQTAQKQTEFKVADEDWDRPDEEKENPRVLWDMSLLEEGAFFPDGMALCVAAASEADFLAFLAQDPYLREGDVFDQVTTYRWTQVNERDLRRDPYNGTPHFVVCADKPNTADLRASTREAHLKHLGDSEKVIMAGPLRGAGGSYVAQTAQDFVAAKRKAQGAFKAARVQAEEERLLKEAEAPARKRTKAEISKAEEAAILLEESERGANIKLKAAKDEASRKAAAEFEAATLAECIASGPVVGSLLLASGHSVEEVKEWCQSDPYFTAGVFESVKVRRAHTVDVTGLYVLSEAEGGESGDVADIMESKRLQAEADLLGNYEGEDDDEDDEDNDEEGDYADGLSDDDDDDDDNGLVDGSAGASGGKGSGGDADDFRK